MPAHAYLAAAYMELGRAEEAHAAVAEVYRISPTASLELVQQRLPYNHPAQLDRILKAWRSAGLK